jgi:natural product precursor
MKKIQKLKFNGLKAFFPILTEEQLREIFGGWNCFSYCLNYFGAPGSMFEHYYNNMFGSMYANNGATSDYIETVLSACGISYSTPSSLYSQGDGRQIIAINNGTHAVIYRSGSVSNGKFTVTYYDPQTESTGTYTYDSLTISAININ